MKTGNLVRNNSFADKFLILVKHQLIVFSFIFISACAINDNLELVSLNGTTMGTTYSVKIIGPKNDPNLKNMQTHIDSLLKAVNYQMSTYIKDSEISLFNSSFDTTWYPVSKDLALVINEAIIISNESGNAYDITIGPIVNLWGFGPEAVPLVVPTKKAISKAKRRTGISKLKVDIDESRIKKIIPDIYVDLSSIAKGFGVDKVGLLLEDLGFKNYMVEIGGEVRTNGVNIKDQNWKIGISTPLSDGLQKVVSISEMSVATSGDYLNYFEKEGVRYSHLINPKTGRPISHNLASVTVINENCWIADAYATAINIMGTVDGYEFALKKKLPVFMIVRENNEFVEKMTPQFEDYIDKGN